VLLGRARDELGLAADRAADPVRDAAGGVRRRAAALERDDLQVVLVAPLAGLARGAHPRRVTTDHDQPFA
jgi:hypothetical protein